MDPLAHGLLGVLIGRSWGIREKKKLWLCAAIAEIPDSDVFASLLNSPPEILVHRAAATHSVASALILAWPLSILLRRLASTSTPNISQWKTYAISLTILLSHVLSDSMTTYGTPLWAPINNLNYSLDWIGNLNWFPSLIMGAGLWMVSKKESIKGLIWAWGGLILFVLGSIALRHQSIQLAYSQQSQSTWSAFPQILLPWRFRAIGENAATYETASIDPISRQFKLTGSYPKASAEDLKLMEKSSVLKLFLKHNRWPIAFEQKISDSAKRMIWGNLLFSLDGTNVMGRAIIDMDGQGTILRQYRDSKLWP